MKTLDIFTGEPRETVMMTVCDSGAGNGSEIMANFECEDEIKTGIQCEKCNEAQYG